MMGVGKEKSNAECKNWRKFVSYLATYFPTLDDATWNYVIPIFSMTLSCFSFGTFYAYVRNRVRRGDFNELHSFGYLILAAAAGIALHYGLMNKNKRKFGFWIMLKITDLILVIGVVIWELVRNGQYFYEFYIIIAIIVSLLNLSLLYCVIQLAKNLPEKESEATYETASEKRPIKEV